HNAVDRYPRSPPTAGCALGCTSDAFDGCAEGGVARCADHTAQGQHEHETSTPFLHHGVTEGDEVRRIWSAGPTGTAAVSTRLRWVPRVEIGAIGRLPSLNQKSVLSLTQRRVDEAVGQSTSAARSGGEFEVRKRSSIRHRR